MDKIKQWAHKEFDEKFFAHYPSGTYELGNGVTGKDIKSFIDSIIDKAIADYQTNYEQKHLVSAVESERERIVGIIEREAHESHEGFTCSYLVNESLECNCYKQYLIYLITNKSDINK